ncbi:MAG: OmpH family outer membrane protein [Armatimonadetes bacterium]|nr:OmpH family outer membrane protein [Armatimonadota bacterium]MDW8154527.1 OmpH family outer membrane protein [Armatimonadota bacterium]
MRKAVVLAWCVLALAGCTRPAVGVVDTQRILNESVLALSYQKELNDREKLMAAELAAAAARLSPRDLEQQRQAYLLELQRLRQELEDRLNRRVREAVAEVARRERIRVVLVKSGVHAGNVRDLTDQVLERLK